MTRLLAMQLEVVKGIAKLRDDEIMLNTSDELIKFAIQKCRSSKDEKATYAETRKIILNFAA